MRRLVGILFILIASLPYVEMFWTRGGKPTPRSEPAETLFIISPHRREAKLEYSRGFSEWMNKKYGRRVEIRWLDAGGTSKIQKDLESRYAASPDAPGVDVLFGGGVAPYYTALMHGWLDRVDLPPEILNGIPPSVAGTPVYDPERRWFGAALSGFGILYNRPLIERLKLPTPANWDDLGSPAFFSWVSSGDPRSSGSIHMCYEIILQAYGFEKGWALITRICANVRSFGEGGGVVPREVAAGEVAAGMAIDQYAQTVIDSVGGGLLVLVLPSRTTMISPDAIGVLTGARSKELADRFVEYVLSPEGQRLLYTPAGENGQRYSLHRLPVRAALYAEPNAPRPNPFQYQGEFKYDEDTGSRRWDIVNDLIGIRLINAHDELARAWKTVIRKGCPPELVNQLCAPPLTEEELAALAAQWKDPRRRLEVTQEWARQAHERYSGLQAME